MGKYEFKALKINGDQVDGEVTAESLTEAREKIRKLLIVPISIEDTENKAHSKKKVSKITVNSKELQIFTRQFAVLIKAGVPLVHGIRSIGGGAKSIQMKTVLTDVADLIEKGTSLSDALRMYPRTFDVIYTSLVAAGEDSGVLDTTLERLATYIEKSNDLKKKIKGAMAYPVIVMSASLLITFGLLVYVFPKFAGMYAKSGQNLPWLTAQVSNASDFAINYWYFIIGGAVGFVFSIKFSYRTKSGKDFLDRFMMATPAIGAFIEKSCIARITRSFSTLLQAGVRISQIFKICGNIAGNCIYEQLLSNVEQLVLRGQSLNESFSAQKRLPSMITQMIAVGEESGSLDIMFGKIADFYEDELDNATETFKSVLEPVMLIFIGGIVAVMVIAMYLPIFSMAASAG